MRIRLRDLSNALMLAAILMALSNVVVWAWRVLNSLFTYGG